MIRVSRGSATLVRVHKYNLEPRAAGASEEAKDAGAGHGAATPAAQLQGSRLGLNADAGRAGDPKTGNRKKVTGSPRRRDFIRSISTP